MRRGEKDDFRSYGYLVKFYFAVGTELLHPKTVDLKPIFSLLSLQTLLISAFFACVMNCLNNGICDILQPRGIWVD